MGCGVWEEEGTRDSSFWPMKLESQQCHVLAWETPWVKGVSPVRQMFALGISSDYCPVLSELSLSLALSFGLMGLPVLA